MKKQYTLDELRAALDASRVSPAEHFARLGRRGIINVEGELTKRFGGTAENSAEQIEPVVLDQNVEVQPR